MYPFERFTQGAKKTLALAQEEAERTHHSYIGTEHLLLGLMREGEGLAARVLISLGLEINKVRTKIESVLGRNERIIIQQIIPTSRVKKVIEISFEEARRMGTNYVGTEHLLLGLMIEGDGIAAHVLQDLGVTLEKVRAEIERGGRVLRFIVLGGTGFVGRAIVEELASCGYQLLIVHRGEHEPPDLPAAEHLHADRSQLSTVHETLKSFHAAAAIDTRALTRGDAEQALAGLPDVRLVVLSSSDVYRAYGSLQQGVETDAVPLDESAPLRSERYPYRGKEDALHDYDKLDVEEVYRQRRATICRLPAVYGEYDYQRREEFILRRVRPGRSLIPIGSGNLLFSRGYVRDIARGIRLALELPIADDQVFNFAEGRTWSCRLLAQRILQAAGSSAELVTVADESLLPADLDVTRTVRQHLLMSSSKARSLLGWSDTDPEEALRRSVAWHLEHPPETADSDFSADERALAGRS